MARPRSTATVAAMMDMVLAWVMVAFGGLTFAGFLFGFSAFLTLMERVVRSSAPKPAPVRVDRPINATRRLWA